MKLYLSLAAFFGLSAVILGAFASHGLRNVLSETMLSAFQTGVQYQFYHCLALLLVVILYKIHPNPLLLWSAGLFVAGILLFSGSLYLLALTQVKWFGPVTPLGGLCFIVAWLSLFVASFRMIEL